MRHPLCRRVAVVSRERASQFQEIRRSLYAVLRNPLSIVGLAIVSLFLLVSLVGPGLFPISRRKGSYASGGRNSRRQMPSIGSGTDESDGPLHPGDRGTGSACDQPDRRRGGHPHGVPLGVLAGYVGGWIGEVIMRVTDIFLAVPGLISPSPSWHRWVRHHQCHDCPLSGVVAGYVRLVQARRCP